jgi:outer membrane autotransporter protein
LNLNTFLGGDGSPSDQLIISGGSATGSTFVHVTNVGGPGMQTTANGIQVVNAIGGGATAPGAFTLGNGELRAGAFTYELFRGGLNPSNLPNNWFLRNAFEVGVNGGGGITGGEEPSVVHPEEPGSTVEVFPSTPPPTTLPPGVLFPIIGPELATDGVVQPLARQLGLSILGTLDDRVGDSYEPDGCAVAPAPETSSVDLPTRKSGGTLPTRKPGPALAPCPLFSPLGLGPLLRPNDQ